MELCIDLWPKHMTTLMLQLLLRSAYRVLRTFLLFTVNKLGVLKKLGGDTTGTPDFNWPLGYSTTHGFMSNNQSWFCQADFISSSFIIFTKNTKSLWIYMKFRPFCSYTFPSSLILIKQTFCTWNISGNFIMSIACMICRDLRISHLWNAASLQKCIYENIEQTYPALLF